MLRGNAACLSGTVAKSASNLHAASGQNHYLFDEIAARLETSRPMVKKYLMKALLHLRLRLEQA